MVYVPNYLGGGPQLHYPLSPLEIFMEIYTKKGYLNSEFRLFHLTDRETHEDAYHYHDFDNVTIFIKGTVS